MGECVKREGRVLNESSEGLSEKWRAEEGEDDGVGRERWAGMDSTGEDRDAEGAKTRYL